MPGKATRTTTRPDGRNTRGQGLNRYGTTTRTRRNGSSTGKVGMNEVETDKGCIGRGDGRSFAFIYMH